MIQLNNIITLQSGQRESEKRSKSVCVYVGVCVCVLECVGDHVNAEVTCTV